jgi:hypothetical protein
LVCDKVRPCDSSPSLLGKYHKRSHICAHVVPAEAFAMDSEAKSEPLRVYVRIRPRVDSMPRHSHYANALRAHDADCIERLDGSRLKLLPLSRCRGHYETTFKGHEHLDGSPTKQSPSDHCRCEFCFDLQGAVQGKLGRHKKEKIMSYQSYPLESSQGDIYSSVCDLAASTIRGYNTTIFAYGAAGTGKTYTMAGTEKKKGVIPRITEDIFVAIQACEGAFHVEVSYVELHNNTFLNLLQAQSDKLTAQGGADLETRKGMEEVGILSVLPAHRHDHHISLHESPLLGVYLAGVPNLRIPVSTC